MRRGVFVGKIQVVLLSVVVGSHCVGFVGVHQIDVVFGDRNQRVSCRVGDAAHAGTHRVRVRRG